MRISRRARPDALEVHRLDVVAVPEVVAVDEGRRRVARRARMHRRRQEAGLALLARERGHEPPQAVHHGVDLGRAAAPRRARRSRSAAPSRPWPEWSSRMLMPPTKPTRASTSAILRCRRRRRLRRKRGQPRSGRKRCTDDARERAGRATNSGAQLAGAEAVDHEPDAARRAAPRASRASPTRAPGRVVGEDVGLEADVVGRRVDRRHERREELGAVAQERHAVAGDQLHAGSRAIVSAQPRGERRVVGEARPGALRRGAASRPP